MLSYDNLEPAANTQRLWAFNAATLICMTLTSLTFFVVVPLLPAIGDLYHQTDSALIQISTAYSVGKLVAAVAQGLIAKRMSMLILVLRCLALYVVASLGLFAMVQLPEPSDTGFVLFLLAYAVVSALSLICQLGLGYLRLVNTAAAYKSLVMVDGMATSALQGVSFVAGGALYEGLGLTIPILLLALVSAAILAALSFTATADIHQRCLLDAQPHGGAAHGSRLVGVRAFLADCVELCLTRQQRAYQAFLLALSVTTVPVYLSPTIFGLIAPSQLQLGPTAIAWVLGAPFAVSVVARGICLMIGHRIHHVTLIRVGLSLMLLSCAIIPVLLQAHAISVSTALLLVYGGLLQAACGIVIPLCKSAALLHVPDRLVSTGASLIRVMQLVLVLLSSMICNATYDGSLLPMSWYFVVLTVVSIVWLEVAVRTPVDDTSKP